jgi:23S rRNA pseudouridine2605 synthase
MADAGIASRRGCEDLIRAGRVTVNGEPAVLGSKVRGGEDRVELDGKPVAAPRPRVVIVLNKPAGYLSSCRASREQGRLVTELVPGPERLFPVGRLDRETEGLLLLTNDGDLALKLTHPRYGKEKEYEAELDRDAGPEIAARLEKGVMLDDGPAHAIRAVHTGSCRLRLVIAEGRKRQVRRMLAALGYEVLRLRRIRIAGLVLSGLEPGGWRKLSVREIETLLRTETG